MIKNCRDPGQRCVARIALIIAGNVLVILSGRYRAIMTGDARTGYYSGVVKYSGCPGVRCMAIVTHVITGNMLEMFTCSYRAVVAA